MDIKINDSFYISDIGPADKAAYVEHLAEKQIYDQTWAIPFPYTEADADWWLNQVMKQTKEQGQSIAWAIRRSDGYLVGGIGFNHFDLGESHVAELGYWLAKPYWNQGIMTEAVRKACDFGFNTFNLVRITAHVFSFNIGSARVLEKAGFQFEGTLKKHYKKAGELFDGKLYARLREQVTH